MATINVSIDRSSWYKMYIEYSISQNAKTAKTTISHALKLEQLTNSYDFDGTMNVSYTIGSETFSYNGNVDIDDKGNAGYTITIKSGTTVIQQNTSNGTGSFYVSCSGSCNSGGYGPGNISLTGYYQSLPTIDRAAPTVSASVSSITASSFTISATSSADSDIYDYSLDNGSTWTRMSTTLGKSATKNISGLSPNTTYNVKVRARRDYNEVYGTSSAVSAKTLGNSLLNSVSTVSADASSVVISMNWTVYAGYTHTLVIKNGSTTVLTITGLTCSVGTNNKTVTLTSAQRTTLLNYMKNMQSFTATFYLTTYSGATQIGSTVNKTATIQTTSAVSAPTFSSFSHSDKDTNETVAITGDDTTYIKTYSILQLVMGTATAKNGAEISSYRVTVGSEVKSFTATVIEYGSIGVSGTVTLKVEAVDSRGYATAVTQNITVYDYEDISINDYMIRRKNEVEPTVQLYFSGDMSPITISNEVKNYITSAKFRYAKNGGSWSGWNNLAVEDNGNSFEFSTTALSNSRGILDFDPNSQYSISIKVVDRLSEDLITIVLNKGTPLVSFRAKKVGINTPDPRDALDVREGNILMNGFRVQGFVAELGDAEHLDDLKSPGIYTQAFNVNASTDRGYPTTKAGYLEIFANPQGYVLHRYTCYDCSAVYLRYFYGDEWYAWKTL